MPITQFIEECQKVHKNVYTYDNIVYAGTDKKISITCSIHGDFEQRASAHLHQKQGCPKCGIYGRKYWSRSKFIEKYKNDTPLLYVVVLQNETEKFIKIGITGQTIKTRFASMYKYTVMEHHFINDSPDIIWDLEKRLHKLFNQYKYIPQYKFQGYTECFTLDARNEALLIIEGLKKLQ